MPDYQDEFSHFTPTDEAQRAIAAATLAEVRARMTDGAYFDLVKAGVVQASTDKESASRIIAAALTVAKIAVPLLGL